MKHNGDAIASYEYDEVGNRLTQVNGNGTFDASARIPTDGTR